MRRRSRKKPIIFFVVVLLIAIVGSVLILKKGKPASRVAQPSQTGSDAVPIASPQTAAAPATIRLIATGDMLPHETVNARAKKADGGYDYLQFMKDAQPIFQKADIRFCNHAVLSSGSQFGISGYPVFNSPTEFITDMTSVGCNLINTATNHTSDKSQAAIDATIDVWNKQQNILARAGSNKSSEEQAKIQYFDIKGVKFAFLAYSTYTNTAPPTPYALNVFNEATASAQLKEAQAAADFVIVSMRWGTEYSSTVNAAQERQSQFLADNGADIILGHGPHVLQPVKKLTTADGYEALVWYSLGNFLNTQVETEALFNGIAVMDIDVASKKIKAPQYLPTYMHYEWTASQKAKGDLLARNNLHMYMLDKIDDATIAKSLTGTTVAAQKARIEQTLNKFTPVKLITSTEYNQ